MTRCRSTACAGRCIRAAASPASSVCAVRKSPPGANPIARTRLSASRRLTSRYSRASRIRAGCSNRASDRLPGIGFDSAHNRLVTWEHLLTQTSEWQGECFGMPDQVEHYRHVSHDPKPPEGRKGELRPLREPGSYWEYNDVRINQLSLALLHLFRRPLPEVFLESVLQPIGGGRDFRWEGYDDAWVEIDGRRLPSVPGGTHWGGGVSISARDQARIGQLLLDGGAYRGRQLIPRDWVQRMH